MTPQEVLLKAADIIEQPGKWTRGKFARRADGTDVGWDSAEAVCFCAIGAIRKVAYEDPDFTWSLSFEAETLLESEVGRIAIFNDTKATDAAHVASVMRKAAQR